MLGNKITAIISDVFEIVHNSLLYLIAMTTCTLICTAATTLSPACLEPAADEGHPSGDSPASRESFADVEEPPVRPESIPVETFDEALSKHLMREA
jgi:hypothetical protein